MSLRPPSNSSGSNAWGDPRPSTTGPGGVEKVWSDEPTPQSEGQQQQQQQQQQQRGPLSRWRELRAQGLGGAGAGVEAAGPRVEGRMYAPSSSSSAAQPSRSPPSSATAASSAESSESVAWQRNLARDSTGQNEGPPPGEYTQQELDFLPYLATTRRKYHRRGFILGGVTSFIALQLFHRRRANLGLPVSRLARPPLPWPPMSMTVLGHPIRVGLFGLFSILAGAQLTAVANEARGVSVAMRGARERGVEDPGHFLGVFVDKLRQRREALGRGETSGTRFEGYEMGAGGVAGRVSKEAQWERQGLVRSGSGSGGQQDVTPVSYSSAPTTGGQDERQEQQRMPPPPATSSWQALRQQQPQSQSRRPMGAPSQGQAQQQTASSAADVDPFTPPPSSSAGGEGTAVGGGAGGGGGSRWAQLRGEKATSGSSWDRLRAEQSTSARSEQRGQQQQREEQW